jgi:hypothetical protein
LYWRKTCKFGGYGFVEGFGSKDGHPMGDQVIDPALFVGREVSIGARNGMG